MRKITILGISALLCTPLLLQGCVSQNPRGTASRPQLTAAEAEPSPWNAILQKAAR